ncbi:PREDICTED: uncharacterized protein LOC106806842 [Priapulus caudatus]|uniref:Uncharacterized protein LOC106806842 n=1 Tax=Priapulus caudatus TaxID=37621 RepID=A0ABM1DWY3_PRICU|nr:PREDICTED: uncharacterized protein LOC106806842 [Priapulus caudatus]
MADLREVRRFLSLKSSDLKKYLRERGVPIGEEKHQELAEKAFWTEKLGLPVKPTDEEAEQAIQHHKSEKLVLDGGIIRLPRPETLTNGWEDGPSSLPDTSRDNLDSYIKAGNRRIGLEKTEGKRTLALGKGLFMSGHVRALQYHGISANLSYCFVRGKVIPQQKTTEPAYHTWVVIQKESGQVYTAECSCIIGIQATCKHIAALLFAVVEAVEEGRTASSTSQKQVWGTVPKKGQALHPPQFVKEIKIVGVREDVSQQGTESTKTYRSEFDPRIPAHRVDKPISAFKLDWLASITNGNCGLLVHTKQEMDPNHQEADVTVCATHETVETCVPVLTVIEARKTLSESKEGVTAEGMITLLQANKHQQEVLAKATSRQASSSLWADHRKGRITASVAGDCIGSVRDGNVSGQSHIARVMGYYGNPKSLALTWGKTNENIARKQYIAHHRLHTKHTGVSCEETGLWVNVQCPYVAASPDGIVSCNQCGRGLLEVKNPYTHRHLPIKDLACQKGSYLSNENGLTQLKRSHGYYAQVQMQLWTSEFQWCDFVVRTVSASDSLFVERIGLDLDYIAAARPKLELFFRKGIVPELVTRNIEKGVIDRAVKKAMESMLVAIESSEPTQNTDYPCGMCDEVCQAHPVATEENSICCDNCDRWFHYICAGIQGSENFLKKRKVNWKCSGCTPKRRVRQRKNNARAKP